MSDYRNEFPELYQYLGGVFHQDWKDVFDWKGNSSNFEGVVRHFKIRNSSDYEKDELRELIEFLDLNLTEHEVENIMDEWSVAFYPPGVSMTYIEWLKNAHKIFEDPIEKTKREFIPEFIG